MIEVVERLQRGIIMLNTRTNFKAMRKMLGFSKKDLALELNVSKSDIKQYEDTKTQAPIPHEVFSQLEEVFGKMISQMAESLERIEDIEAQTSNAPKCIDLTLFSSQEEYDAHGRDKGAASAANMRSLLLGATLLIEGYEVNFACPQDFLKNYDREQMLNI